MCECAAWMHDWVTWCLFEHTFTTFLLWWCHLKSLSLWEKYNSEMILTPRDKAHFNSHIWGKLASYYYACKLAGYGVKMRKKFLDDFIGSWAAIQIFSLVCIWPNIGEENLFSVYLQSEVSKNISFCRNVPFFWNNSKLIYEGNKLWMSQMSKTVQMQ